MFSSMNNLTRIASLIGFLTVGNLFLIDAAAAFSITFSGTENFGFEEQYDGWTTFGDTTVESTFQTISPQGGDYQALITNACHDCVDNGSIRNDDSHVNNTASTFNYSDTNPITASVEQYNNNNLQSQLGISENALNINATLNGSNIDGVYRTPKEGSAILSDSFTVDESFEISFDWNYLTNDGASILGNQDFSFVTITGIETASGNPVEFVIPLGDSGSSIPSDSSINFAEGTGYSTYTSDLLAPGNYQVGFGVVDIDNVDRSSALLVDEIYIRQAVPFEFSPTAGIALVLGLFGCDRLRRKMNSHNN